MRINEVMSHPVVTAPQEATLDAIARLMWEFDCGIVPLVGDDGRLKGVITDRDVCMAAYTQGKPLSSISAASAMSKDVISCHTTDSVETTERLMRDNQIRRVPVLDAENRPVGIVSMNDIVRLAARAHKSGVDREFVETLAAVCQPRAGARLETSNVIAPPAA
jgi:CBS domain-containing protein